MRRLFPCFAPLLLVTLAACAPGSGAPPRSDDGIATCPDTIVIENFSFRPDRCAVTVGTALSFVNRDRAAHTATSDEVTGTGFDTDILEEGEVVTLTFEEVGAYPYSCRLHPSMRGMLTVRASP